MDKEFDEQNQIAFNSTKPHIFLREGSEDECQSCGFPKRFHERRK